MASSLCSIRRSLFTTKSLNPKLFLNVFRASPVDFYKQQDPTLVRCYSVNGSPPSDPSFKGNQENVEEFASPFGNARGSYGGLRFGSANANQRISPSNSFNFNSTQSSNQRDSETGNQENLQEFTSPFGNARGSYGGLRFGSANANQRISPSNSFNFNSSQPWNQRDAQTGRTMDPMNFVKGILGQDRRGHDVFGRWSPQSRTEQNADVVHIKMLRNNTFVTVTDSKGNKKIGASAGSLPGGGKVSRYGAEATAEHVGRLAKSMGLKAVVVRVNGFTYFKKKKQAILGFREGFTNSRGDANPIVYIEDTTRKPHNGCRLPRQRRV